MDAMSSFRAKLTAGKLCIGTGISFADPLVTDALGPSLDYVWIDLEHSNMSPEVVSGHMLAARRHGIPALVRVQAGEAAFIKPILDAGADGIIVPVLKTVAEVERVVADCRYPPVGRRGFGPRVPSNYGRDSSAAVIKRENARVFVAVMAETRELVEAIDEVAAVPGLDSVVLGPWDLSGALGRLGEVEHPEVVAAIERVIGAVRGAGKFIGSGMGPDGEYGKLMAQRGVQWLQVGGDFGYLVAYAEQLVRNVRGAPAG